MRVVVQRVLNAKCVVDNSVVGSINKGFLLLVGFGVGDDLSTVKKLAKKVSGLRIFEDDNSHMNKSLNDVDGSILSISQFTLYASCKKGNRPSFTDSLDAQSAKDLYIKFNEELRNYDLKVETGVFQAHMKLDFVNDGPVTIILDSLEL